jgi:hypothetical protein
MSDLATAAAPHRVRGSAAPVRRPDPRPTPRPGRAPAPARREHLRIVQPNERTTRRLTPLAGAVLTGIVFAVLFAVAGAHSLIAQGQIRLDALDTQVRAEQARYQVLAKNVAAMESPGRIVAAAEAQGMVAPQDLVYLQPDTAAHPSSNLGTTDASGGRSISATPPPTSWSTVKPMLEAPTP